MIKQSFERKPAEFLIFHKKGFHDWISINDSIMGGNSKASCYVSKDGLVLQGELVEEGGGFVSCTSPRYGNPYNLSEFVGLRIQIDGAGRTFKVALRCKPSSIGMANLYGGGLCWVYEFPTDKIGTTTVKVLFNDLKPTVRAKPVRLPLQFNSSAVIQFQVLHSKFGLPGKLNKSFIEGPINMLLRSISAFT